MVASDFLRMLHRRWPVVLTGLVVSCIASVLIHGKPGVFHASADVYLHVPSSTAGGDYTFTNRQALIGVADQVATVMRSRTSGVTPTSDYDVTLPSMGVRHGSQVLLPNSGGQFSPSYQLTFLRVSTAGPNASGVRLAERRLVSDVIKTLDRTQVAQQVPPEQRITAAAVPEDPVVSYAQGRPGLAAAAVLALGGALTLLITLEIDRACRGRTPLRRRRT